MNQFIQQIKRLLIMLVSIVVVGMMTWLFTSFSPFVAGITLGLLIGFLNTIYTAFKVHKISEALATGKGRPRLGMSTRFAMAGLGALLAIRFPEHVSVIGLVIGLFLTQVFAIGDAIYSQSRDKQYIGERGE